MQNNLDLMILPFFQNSLHCFSFYTSFLLLFLISIVIAFPAIAIFLRRAITMWEAKEYIKWCNNFMGSKSEKSNIAIAKYIS